MLSLFKLGSFSIVKSICFTILLFTNFSIAQEKKIELKIKKNPINDNYWWLEKNNFGKNPSLFDFETIFEFKKGKSNFVINISSKNKKNKIENIYFNESFIKYNFSKFTFLRI